VQQEQTCYLLLLFGRGGIWSCKVISYFNGKS
jgi:hypothetical protein